MVGFWVRIVILVALSHLFFRGVTLLVMGAITRDFLRRTPSSAMLVQPRIPIHALRGHHFNDPCIQQPCGLLKSTRNWDFLGDDGVFPHSIRQLRCGYLLRPT